MIDQPYHNAKTAVLDICKRYLRYHNNTGDNVKVALETRVKEVINGRYVLAVVGEAKAGKSTLINALLGEDILPTGTLQTSSTVVEICKSEEKYLEVHYADGHSETVPEDKVSQCLKQLATIRDKDRSSQGDGNSDSAPTKIIYHFPLKYASKELRLVDTPGVNAIGKIKDVTHGYIREAHAVLFVLPLTSSVESQSFYDFVDEVVTERDKDALFLILTHSGNSEYGTKEKTKEAHRLYNGVIGQDRILSVDSLHKIVSREIRDFGSADSLKNYYQCQQRNSKTDSEKYIFEAKQDLLNKILSRIGNNSNLETVQRELNKLSNFDELESLLKRFSMKIPSIELSDLLRLVRGAYKNQIVQDEESIDHWEKKRKHPQTFENDINKIQELLADYQHLMNKFSEGIRKDFTGVGAGYIPSLNKLKEGYNRQIKKAKKDVVTRKALENFYIELHSLIDDTAKKVEVRFREESERLGEEFKAKHAITAPTVNAEKIKKEAEELAYEKREEPRKPKGLWEWVQKVATFGLRQFKKKSRVINKSRALDNFKSIAQKKIEEGVENGLSTLKSIVHYYGKRFRDELNILIDTRSKTLEEIKKSQAKNNEILEKIKKIGAERKVREDEVERIDDILGDIR